MRSASESLPARWLAIASCIGWRSDSGFVPRWTTLLSDAVPSRPMVIRRESLPLAIRRSIDSRRFAPISRHCQAQLRQMLCRRRPVGHLAKEVVTLPRVLKRLRVPGVELAHELIAPLLPLHRLLLGLRYAVEVDNLGFGVMQRTARNGKDHAHGLVLVETD